MSSRIGTLFSGLMPSSPKILLVDRSPEEAETLAMPLRVAGYQLLIAHEAPQAEAALVRPVPPRLLVIDEALPEISAPELVALGHARIATLPVIVLADGEYASRYRAADCFLKKPVASDELTRRALALLPMPA